MSVYGPVSSLPGAPTGSAPDVWTWINPNAWQSQLLLGLNLPITHTTVTALDAWTLSEGTLGSNNPLAISGKYPGATHCIAQCGSNSPVYAYDSMASGVAATVKFLSANGQGYPSIRSSLANANWAAEQTGASQTIGGKTVGNVGLLNAIWAAVNGSGWCRGCQGGKYPVRLADLVNGQGFSAGDLAAVGGASAVGATGTPVTGFSASEQGAAQPGVGPVNPLADIAAFFKLLTSGLTWLRLMEILAGAVFMAIGAAMYVTILVPGIGGIAATIAGGPTAGLAGRAVSQAGQTRRATVAQREQTNRTRLSEEFKLQRSQEAASERRYRAANKPTGHRGPGDRTRGLGYEKRAESEIPAEEYFF